MELSNIKNKVQIVERQNEVKAKLKRAFTRIDEGKQDRFKSLLVSSFKLFIEKQGTVKQAIFFQILECLDVSLNFKERQYIIKILEKNGKITYLEAVKLLMIN